MKRFKHDFLHPSLRIALALATVAAGLLSVAEDTYCLERDGKTGILFIHTGTDETYSFDWHIQFMNNLYDFFPTGQYAGGLLEGGGCYSLIHFANQAEASICGVTEGTPIDVFCAPYTNGDTYPVHSVIEHFGFWRGTFFDTCYPDLFFPLMMLWQMHSTVNPSTGQPIDGPVVEDPNGTGVGIPDFYEVSGFNRMDYFYRLPNQIEVHRMQALQWWYGNEAPGYDSQPEELENIRDRLVQQQPHQQFVFRHGWECYMENKDVYEQPALLSESTETAIDELINDEGVGRIIVFHSVPSFSNLSQFGHEWYYDSGKGVSAVAGKTFKECVEDLGDGYGPANEHELNAYLMNKPWSDHWKHPWPLIKQMVEERDAAVEVSFAPGYGAFEEFGRAVVEMLNYTANKYSIPKNASLKVILAHHGYYGAYMDAQNCDAYTSGVENLYERVKQSVEDDFSWDGEFEVGHGAGEYAEGEYGEADVPTPAKPFGEVMSVGEHIDAAINGKWVNSQGQLIDNGLDNFQYIIVMPYFFDTESADTVFGMRKVLGNNIPPNYRRDDTDQDGTKYDAGDIDAEYFTVKTYDATGWPSTPKGSWRLLNKGSGSVPTTVIVTGAFLSIGNGAVRTHLTEAAVKAILSKAGTKSGAESPFSVDGTTSNGGCGCSVTGRSTVVESPAGTALMLVGLFVVWFRGLLKRR